MDIIDTPPYTDMQRLYSRYFSLGYLNPDINAKFALISLICYLTDKIKSKKPDTTHYQIIRKILGNDLPEDLAKGLAVVCSDFAHGCTQFPTFGIDDKNIPAKIKEIMSARTPF